MFPVAAVRYVGNDEVAECCLANENETACCDQRLKALASISTRIDARAEGGSAEEYGTKGGRDKLQHGPDRPAPGRCRARCRQSRAAWLSYGASSSAASASAYHCCKK